MDASDLSKIVELHGIAIYGFCYFLTKDKDKTDELYQETFLKALELRHKISLDRNPKSFIISIAIRLWKNNCRKLARQEKIFAFGNFNDEIINNLPIHKNSPEDLALSNELNSMVRMAADSLSNKLKFPLYMYYSADMSIEEIAIALRIPKGTVKSRLHNARKLVKKKLEEVYEYEGS